MKKRTLSLQALFPPDRLLRIGRVWIVFVSIAYLLYLADYFDFKTFHFVTQRGWQVTPLGRDFLLFWSGARLTLNGYAGQLFNTPFFSSFYDHIAGQGSVGPLNDYSYPPTFLLLTLPFGMLPYLPALFLWLLSSVIAFWAALKQLAPKNGALFLALASPALPLDLLYGQNALFTGAALGGGLALLPKRPWIAGFLFGLLSVKPQLGLILPFALLAGREGKAFVAATVTTIALALASVLAFGPDLWSGYLQHCTTMRQIFLERWTPDSHLFVSAYKAAQLVGFGKTGAYAVQGVFAILAVGGTVWLWARKESFERRAAGTIIATFLVTLFAKNYDMAVLTFAAIWIMRLETKGEKQDSLFLAAALLFLAPAFSSTIVYATGWLLPAPFLLLLSFFLLLKTKYPVHP